MSENFPPTGGANEKDAVRADIAATRAELSETVDALSQKLDVKHIAAEKVGDARRKVSETAARAKQSAPEPVQHALDRAGEKAGPLAHQMSEKAKPHRNQILIGVAVITVVLIVIRRRTSKQNGATHG